MSDLINITCPKCAMPMQLQRPASDAVLACPKCGRSLIVTPSGSVSSGTPSAFHHLPSPAEANDQIVQLDHVPRVIPVAPDQPSVARAAPVAEPLPPRPSRPTKSSTRSVLWLIPVMMVFMLMALIGMAVFVFQEPIAALLRPTTKTNEAHQLVILRAGRTLGEVADVMREVRAGTAEQPQEDLKRFAAEFRDLTLRAAQLPPLDRNQLQTLEDWARDNVPPRSIAQLLVQSNEQRMQLDSRDLNKDAAVEAEFAINDFLAVTSVAWKSVPMPTSEIERLEWEVIEVIRRIWAAQYQVTNSDQYQELSDVFGLASRQLTGQRVSYRQLNSGIEVFRGESPYLETAAALLVAQAQRFEYLESQFGSLDQALEYHSFEDTKRKFFEMSRSQLQSLAFTYRQGYRLGDSNLKQVFARYVDEPVPGKDRWRSGGIRSRLADPDDFDD